MNARNHHKNPRHMATPPFALNARQIESPTRRRRERALTHSGWISSECEFRIMEEMVNVSLPAPQDRDSNCALFLGLVSPLGNIDRHSRGVKDFFAAGMPLCLSH